MMKKVLCHWGIVAVCIVMVSQLISFSNLSDRLKYVANDDTATEQAPLLLIRNQTTVNSRSSGASSSSSTSSSVRRTDPSTSTSTSTPLPLQQYFHTNKQKTNDALSLSSSEGGSRTTRSTSLSGDLRLCRFSSLPQPKKPPRKIRVPTELETETELFIGFQCSGPEYDKCSMAAQKLARNPPPNHSSNWAKEGIPLLPKKQNSSRSILFIGNSHIGQIYQALACQYQNEIKQLNWEYITFNNDISIFKSMNEPWHYDVQSRANLTYAFEKRFHGRHPHTFDAIILGDFNGGIIDYNFSLASTRHEKFYKDLLLQASKRKLTLNGHLTITDLATQFHGPILRVTGWNFKQQWLDAEYQEINTIQQKIMKNRNNIRLLWGGQYIQNIGHCSHEHQHTQVVDAGTNPLINSTHRCIGGKGGHPDLLAYDIVEVLGKLLTDTVP